MSTVEEKTHAAAPAVPDASQAPAPEPVPFTKERRDKIDKVYGKSGRVGISVILFSICVLGLCAACVAKLPHWPLRSAIIFNLAVAVCFAILGFLPWVRVRPRSRTDIHTATSGKVYLIGFTLLWLAIGIAVAVTYSKSPPQGWKEWHDSQLTKRRGGHGGGGGHGGYRVGGSSGGGDSDDEDFFNGVGGELIAIMVFDFVNFLALLYRCIWLADFGKDMENVSPAELEYAYEWQSSFWPGKKEKVSHSAV